ncbi:MAG: hypothetical protein AAFO91_19405 [Bacteroidota bacterium]
MLRVTFEHNLKMQFSWSSFCLIILSHYQSTKRSRSFSRCSQWNVDGGDDEKGEAQQGKKPQQQQEELKANDGKIELSLVQFHISNPQWRPHRGEQRFLDDLEAQANRDVARLGGGGGNCFDQSLTGSFLHNQLGGFQVSVWFEYLLKCSKFIV